MKPVDTLRVSVTDRCNLRCIYCLPPSGVPLIPHHDILRFEEIERVVRSAVAAGVTKVRITGGEPLVRRGIIGLIEKLRAVPGLRDLPLTTNGILLGEMAPALKAAGLSRVTVSLDTLRPDRYEKITGQPWLMRVHHGIAEARRVGLSPVKINVVVVPGANEDEVKDFVRLASDQDLEIRFIERMPIRSRALSPHCGLSAETYLPAQRLREIIETDFGKLVPGERGAEGPARVFKLPAGRGQVGFISPISEPFCRTCTRMRLTPDGKLRSCLAQELEVDVRGPLRRGVSDQELISLFRAAVANKPEQDAACFTPTNRLMSQIGG